MPGILGLITKMPRHRARRELLQMLSSVHREPSYTTGIWMDETLGVYVGWVAREGSFSDQMPVHNKQGDTVIFFSGEEFTELGTEQDLDHGRKLSSEGLSYLCTHYAEDPRFPANLNGRFHGLLADQKRGMVMIFNDRYGMHRLYYHESKEAFYFAAEAKAILAVRPELRNADPRGMGEFVSCGCVLENRSLFKYLYVLPSASAWVFRNCSVERKAYFHAREWENQDSLQPEAYYRELREVFAQGLPRYFKGTERVGMSLTGGLDTRMIMAWWKSAPRSLPCYSFGGMYRDCEDVVLARRVAEMCRQTHEVIHVAEEFLARFPQYAERSVHITDGCVDVSHAADLYVNERAAGIAPVRMTGNYGGEVLRRVRAFKPVDPAPGLFAPEFLTQVAEAKATYAGVLQGHPLSFAVFKQAPWHHYGLLSLEQSQISLRSPFLDNDFVKTVFRAPQSACVNNDISLRLIADGDERLAQIRTDRGLMTAGKRGIRTSTLRRLIDFTVKAEYAYDYGMPQWVARIDHVFSQLHLERLFLGRHKFYHYRVWYRDALSWYVREMLLDSRTLSRPYLQRKTVEALVQGHLRGDRNYTSEIHKLLTLEIISRVFLDQ